ncbi:MAG: glycoside hydrolase family 2 TIM barrel-domain containing protein, partial [Ignavibacteriales bacterium]
NTGGIWNSVNLYYGTDIFPETVKVTPRLIENGRARILIDVSCISRIPNPENRLITFTVTSPSGSVTEIRENFLIEPGCTRMNTAFDLDEPELWYSWDTGKQNLYIINSEIFLHAVEFGIREVMLDSSSNFYLNGKKLFLRGTNMIPELQLSSLNRYRIGDMAERIKRANINIVRVHAHINRRELYEEFTRAGILIWQDFSLQWTYDDSTAFVPNAVSQIKDMVRQLYNYPSIAFWCCHNEPGEQIRTLDPFLRDAVLSEDNSRIVRLASNYEEHAYDGWYWGSMEHFAAAPMGPLVTEFGAQAIPEMESLEDFQTAGPLSDINWKEWEYHNFQFEQTFNIADVKTGETLDDFIYNSQMYQAGLITKAVHFYRRRKNNGITGIFQFMLIDPWPAITWSVVDYYRREKAGYYALQKAYEPLLVSVNLWQKRYIPEGKLMLDIKIINDRWQDFNRCCLIVKMDNNVLWESVEMNIPENQVVSLGPNDTGIFVPPQIPAGIKELEFVLTECHSGKILARSDLSVEIAKRNDVF